MNNINTEKSRYPKGEIFILMKNKDNYIKEIYYENLIVDEFGRFLAMCCQDPTALSSGITWMALGTGDTEWDPTSPPPPSITNTALVTEVCRKYRTASGGFKFLNPDDLPNETSPSGTSSRIMEIAWLFDFNQANNYQFMELGMYANSNLTITTPYYSTVTSTPVSTIIADSAKKGILVNKKNFPVFTKTADWQLSITYRVTFGG